jgi:heme/copper-type cytochrome/quinol oxidase subunit 2
MTSYNKSLNAAEIEGRDELETKIRNLSNTLIVLIIITGGVGLLTYILSGFIVNNARTGNQSKTSHGIAITTELLLVISAFLLAITLVVALYFVAFIGYANYVHLPHGNTLKEFYQHFDAYSDVKGNPRPFQVDATRRTANIREAQAAKEIGGVGGNVGDIGDGRRGINTLPPQGQQQQMRTYTTIQTPISQFQPSQFQPPQMQPPQMQASQSLRPSSQSQLLTDMDLSNVNSILSQIPTLD